MTAPLAPHGGQPVFDAGAPLAGATAAMIMLHGRGASAGDILSLIPYLDVNGVAYLAPQARQNTWCSLLNSSRLMPAMLLKICGFFFSFS